MPSALDVYHAAKVFGNPLDDAGDFFVRSKSRPTTGYWMSFTPEGYAVHQQAGCQGEQFRGPLACWHSKEYSKEIIMTTAIAPYEGNVPVRIDFDEEQINAIAKVICRQGDEVAPLSFVSVFIAACRHTGLDPFMKQIWALKIRGNWTVYTGIDGWRTVSQRSGLDAGMDGPEWSDDGETWSDVPLKTDYKLCRVGIWRKGVPRPYVAVVTLAVKRNDSSDSWKKDPMGMLAISAERLARRRAFPADTSILADYDVEVANELPPDETTTPAEVSEGAYREIDPATGEGQWKDSETHEPVKSLNLDADREKNLKLNPEDLQGGEATLAKVVETANKNAATRKAAPKAKAPPAPPEAHDEATEEPPPLQEQYDNAFREALEEKAAAQEAEVVARPEPPKGEPQSVAGAPATKAQEMSHFWSAAKKFEKDTTRIIALSREHFGATPAELEGTRRAQLIALLETGLLPEQPEYDHDPVPVYTEDGVMVCDVCEAKLVEETGKHI